MNENISERFVIWYHDRKGGTRLICGIGTDIVEIARVRKTIAREAFRTRVFTELERAYADGRGKQAAASYAARFAAKEAVLKAFGTGLRGGALAEIEVHTDALGAPSIALHGYFAHLAAEKRIARILISLSHSREYATATCVMEG